MPRWKKSAEIAATSGNRRPAWVRRFSHFFAPRSRPRCQIGTWPSPLRPGGSAIGTPLGASGWLSVGQRPGPRTIAPSSRRRRPHEDAGSAKDAPQRGCAAADTGSTDLRWRAVPPWADHPVDATGPRQAAWRPQRRTLALMGLTRGFKSCTVWLESSAQPGRTPGSPAASGTRRLADTAKSGKHQENTEFGCSYST